MSDQLQGDLSHDQASPVVEDVSDEKVSENSRPASLQDTAKHVSVSVQEDKTLDSRKTADNRPMFVPRHGNGALLRSPGFPPNMIRPGGQSSPTTLLRDQMREGLSKMLPSLFAGVKSGKINKLQFADFLAKYSIGVTGTITHISPDVISRLEKQAMLIASRPTWDSADLLQAMRDIWA